MLHRVDECQRPRRSGAGAIAAAAERVAHARGRARKVAETTGAVHVAVGIACASHLAGTTGAAHVAVGAVPARHDAMAAGAFEIAVGVAPAALIVTMSSGTKGVADAAGHAGGAVAGDTFRQADFGRANQFDALTTGGIAAFHARFPGGAVIGDRPGVGIARFHRVAHATLVPIGARGPAPATGGIAVFHACFPGSGAVVGHRPGVGIARFHRVAHATLVPIGARDDVFAAGGSAAFHTGLVLNGTVTGYHPVGSVALFHAIACATLVIQFTGGTTAVARDTGAHVVTRRVVYAVGQLEIPSRTRTGFDGTHRAR